MVGHQPQRLGLGSGDAGWAEGGSTAPRQFSGNTGQAPFSAKITFIHTHRVHEQWVNDNMGHQWNFPTIFFSGLHSKPHMNVLSMSG